jgi:hypothetical protein
MKRLDCDDGLDSLSRVQNLGSRLLQPVLQRRWGPLVVLRIMRGSAAGKLPHRSPPG